MEKDQHLVVIQISLNLIVHLECRREGPPGGAQIITDAKLPTISML